MSTLPKVIVQETDIDASLILTIDGKAQDTASTTTTMYIRTYGNASLGESPELTITGTNVTPTTSGIVAFSISNTQTDGLDTGTYMYEIRHVDSSSKISSVEFGQFTVKQKLSN